MEEKKTVGQRHIYTQEIMKRLMETPEGETVKYSDLSSIIGIDVRPSGKGYCFQKTAREIIEKTEGIVFDPVDSVGLRRMLPDEVAKTSAERYTTRKRSLLRRAKIRIDTVSDRFEELSQEGKYQATVARTIIAFDSEILKSKNIKRLNSHIAQNGQLIGFEETLAMFKK